MIAGYVGMGLLLLSYLLRDRFMVWMQFLATGFLLAYSLQLKALPFIILELAVLFVIAFRLAVRAH